MLRSRSTRLTGLWHERTKYGSRRTTYGGRTFQSRFEANYASDLDLLARAGEIKGYETQYKIPLVVNGKLITTYYADFHVFHNDGSEEIVETKGFWTDYSRLKWALFEAIYAQTHPDVKITMIKMKSSWKRYGR